MHAYGRARFVTDNLGAAQLPPGTPAPLQHLERAETGEGIGEALEGSQAAALPNTRAEGLHQPPASKEAMHPAHHHDRDASVTYPRVPLTPSDEDAHVCECPGGTSKHRQPLAPASMPAPPAAAQETSDAQVTGLMDLEHELHPLSYPTAHHPAYAMSNPMPPRLTDQGEVIRGHQRSSEVIRGHQRSSEVISMTIQTH